VAVGVLLVRGVGLVVTMGVLTHQAERPAGFPNADLYQMLAYCTVLGVAEGHLVYAKGSEQPANHDVKGRQVRIRCHSLDLSKSPQLILEGVTSLADDMTFPALTVGGVSQPGSGRSQLS